MANDFATLLLRLPSISENPFDNSDIGGTLAASSLDLLDYHADDIDKLQAYCPLEPSWLIRGDLLPQDRQDPFDIQRLDFDCLVHATWLPFLAVRTSVLLLEDGPTYQRGSPWVRRLPHHHRQDIKGGHRRRLGDSRTYGSNTACQGM
jgi:hypothetical protein